MIELHVFLSFCLFVFCLLSFVFFLIHICLHSQSLASYALLNFWWLNFIIVLLFGSAIFKIHKIECFYPLRHLLRDLHIVHRLFTTCSCSYVFVLVFVHFPAAENFTISLPVLNRNHTWLHLKHLEFCNFFNEKGKNFSDLHFAVKWRIIFPQDRIIVTLEKGNCLLSMSWYSRKLLNIICSECSRALILKTTFYEHCLHKVKLFETGGISQSQDSQNNMCVVIFIQFCLQLRVQA